MRGLLKRRPSPALLVALLALFVALGGPAEAARLINGKNIRSGTVSSKQLKDRGIGVRDLSRATITATRYTPNNSITAAKIRKDAVGTSEIKAGAVNSLQVADNSLIAQDLATNSVNSDEIVDGAVKNAELGTSAVTKGKLAGNSVGSSEVSDGTLTGKDIGAFSGTANVDLPAIASGECKTAGTQALTPLSGAQDLRDDLIVIGRPVPKADPATPPNLPANVTLSAQADPASATAFTIVACNVAPRPATSAAPDTTAFSGGPGYAVPFLTVNP